MDLFPRYLFQGIGHWAWGIGAEERNFPPAPSTPPLPSSLELAKKWKKRCEVSLQRFFQEGIMDILRH
ncbi:hypothetical protein [Nostoc sp.]|uniref:hypothetical protein n=1 Tax=Nostoc sp. TaxID=1180 RepID=UPI002FFA26A6